MTCQIPVISHDITSLMSGCLEGERWPGSTAVHTQNCSSYSLSQQQDWHDVVCCTRVCFLTRRQWSRTQLNGKYNWGCLISHVTVSIANFISWMVQMPANPFSYVPPWSIVADSYPSDRRAPAALSVMGILYIGHHVLEMPMQAQTLDTWSPLSSLVTWAWF